MTAHLKNIVDFSVGLPEGWHVMPLDGDEVDGWAQRTAAGIAPHDIVEVLAAQLGHAQSQFVSMDDPTVTAAVWVPYPETGTAGGAVLFGLGDIDDIGTIDQAEQALAATGTSDDGSTPYFAARTWRENVEAGPYVGSYNMVAHDDGLDAQLEERCVIVVYPEGAAQCVQFVFSAANLGAFENMPQQAHDFVSDLEVRLGDAA